MLLRFSVQPRKMKMVFGLGPGFKLFGSWISRMGFGPRSVRFVYRKMISPHISSFQYTQRLRRAISQSFLMFDHVTFGQIDNTLQFLYFLLILMKPPRGVLALEKINEKRLRTQMLRLFVSSFLPTSSIFTKINRCRPIANTYKGKKFTFEIV